MSKIISVIVPCYDEQDVLPIFYKAITTILSEMNYDYEILLINDGSRDHTLEVMKELYKKDSHIHYLSFSRNFGKEAAIYAGLCNVEGDYIAVMDADMQDSPSLLPQMVSILETEAYDSVATRRRDREGEPVVRSWFAGLFYKIINKISDTDIMDGARDFRLMKRKMTDAIVAMEEYNRFSKGIFGWVGFKTYWLSFDNIERAAGKTKWDFWKLIKYAIDGIINFSQVPLSIASWSGITMTGISAIALVVIIIRKLFFGDPVAGWASTICVIIFIGGIQLLCLGIIGQYLAKIYVETKKRPHYIIAETNKENVKVVN